MKNKNTIDTSTENPDFSKWEYQYPEGLTDDDILALWKERQIIFAPTGSVHENGKEQMLPAMVTQPSELKTDTIIIRIPAWNVDLGNEQNGLFDAYLAGATGARVISINAPGIYGEREEIFSRTQPNDLTPEQHEDLDQASFRKVGGAMLRAAIFAEETLRTSMEDTGADTPLPQFIVWGGSQGAAVAAGAVGEAVESGVADRIHTVIFDEQVNDHERTIGNLMKGAEDSSKDTKEYVKWNPEAIREADEGLLRFGWRGLRRLTANKEYLKALTGGSFRADLGDPKRFHEAGFDASVIVLNGSKSVQSSSERNDQLCDWLKEAGVPVKRVELEGDSHDRLINVQSAVSFIGPELAA